jgi:CheY-like chemotaxis protein
VAEQVGGRSKATKGDAPSHDASGIRILLVEDNEMNQQVASELLESAGAMVTIANHGGEAVKILTEGDQPPPFDVVLMDLQMPEMDGYTATRLLRADLRLQSLPIIAMTAHALVEERQRCLAAGMNDHVTKPIDPDALFATLGRWAKPRPAGEAEPASRPGKAAADVILPEIEGIDVSGGLKRVAGNKRLYLDLLAQFTAKQGDAARQIYAAIASGDRKLAERIAHTVKGVAGNIGIASIYAASGKLESAVRDGDAAVPGLLNQFASLLARQVQLIQQAVREVTPVQPQTAASAPFDANAASSAVERLRVLLEASDGDAAEAFPRLAEALGDRGKKPRLDALNAAITDFDFEGALLKLDEIAKECGVNEKRRK